MRFFCPLRDMIDTHLARSCGLPDDLLLTSWGALLDDLLTPNL